MTLWGDASQPHGPDEAPRGPNWPDDEPTTPRPAARRSRTYGPKFAWRARVLWAIGAVFYALAAILAVGAAWLTFAAGTPMPALLVLAVWLAFSAAAFIVTRQALGERRSWPATPSLVLAWSFIIGGLARAAVALVTTHGLLIPLEPLAGIWLLMAVDRPALRLGRPVEWRSGGMVALIVVIELAVVGPLVPVSAPFMDRLTSGPDSLDLTLHVDCPPPDAPWARVPVAVGWQLGGFDLISGPDDQVRLEVSGRDAARMSWETLDASLSITQTSDEVVEIAVPRGVSRASTGADLLPTEGGTPASITVTATYSHMGIWSKAKSESCTAP